MSGKVTVTKEVAVAIESAKGFFNLGAFVKFADGEYTGLNKHSQILRKELDKEALLHALFYGYEVEKSAQEKVREYYKENTNTYRYERWHTQSAGDAIVDTLNLLGIKIEGVNA